MGYGDISTHDLTKRSTSVALYTNVLFPFQLTTSRRGRRQKCRRVHSKIQKFQLTTSRRGRPYTPGQYLPFTSISTHDLTKRSTRSADARSPIRTFQLTTSRRGRQEKQYAPEEAWIFQLTTSRRGRRRQQNTRTARRHFNSRPHEEVDISVICRYSQAIHFNSRPHEEVDEVCRPLQAG